MSGMRKTCEVPRHCNRLAEHIRGLKWMRNDQVNCHGRYVRRFVSAVILHIL